MKSFRIYLLNGKVLSVKGLNVEKALKENKINFQDMSSWELEKKVGSWDNAFYR